MDAIGVKRMCWKAERNESRADRRKRHQTPTQRTNAVQSRSCRRCTLPTILLTVVAGMHPRVGWPAYLA